MNWNAFEDADSPSLKQSADFGNICREELYLYDQTIICRKRHLAGEREHETLVKDDTGQKTVAIRWVS